MNKKEVNELRRRWKPDKNAVSRLYGCFVNSNREIVADLDESLGLMPQEEAEKYLNLLKKVLSGALGKICSISCSPPNRSQKARNTNS